MVQVECANSDECFLDQATAEYQEISCSFHFVFLFSFCDG